LGGEGLRFAGLVFGRRKKKTRPYRLREKLAIGASVTEHLHRSVHQCPVPDYFRSF
jgi:hypothetical protein